MKVHNKNRGGHTDNVRPFCQSRNLTVPISK